MSTKRLAVDASLTALALTIFIVEAQIPFFLAVPGIKLGLSNIVTLIAVYIMSKKDAAAILVLRIFLGGIFSGNMVALIYSVAGGALSYAAICVSSIILSEKQIWAVSIFSAVFHNIGQLLAAAFIMNTLSVLNFLPVLVIAAVFLGAFTGLCAQYTVLRLKNIRLK